MWLTLCGQQIFYCFWVRPRLRNRKFAGDSFCQPSAYGPIVNIGWAKPNGKALGETRSRKKKTIRSDVSYWAFSVLKLSPKCWAYQSETCCEFTMSFTLLWIWDLGKPFFYLLQQLTIASPILVNMKQSVPALPKDTNALVHLATEELTARKVKKCYFNF